MRNLSIILFLLYFSNIKSQQISQYSNFLETAFYLNPAISSLGNNLKLLYRNQWTGFQGAPKTTFISYQSSFFHKKDLKSVSMSSIGGFIQNEKMGAFRNFKAKFSYSYSFLINSRLRVSFGTFIGLQQLGIDVTSMDLFDSNDPVVDISKTSYMFPDFSMGLLISNKNNFFGVSIKQLFENNWNNLVSSNLSKNKASFILMGGKKIKFSNYTFSPTIMTTFTGGIKPVFLLGFQAEYKEVFAFGLYIKNENLFSSQIKINISKNIQLSYAHDLFISNFSNSNLNSSEFMIIYTNSISKKINRNNPIIYF